MKKKLLVLLLLLAFSFLSVLSIPEVYAPAIYTYDGFSTITITGSTANFAGWYSADIGGGWGTIGISPNGQYYLITSGLTNVDIGDGGNITLFWDWAKQVHMGGSVIWTIYNNATLRFGRITGAEADKKTIVGCQLYALGQITGQNGSIIQLYDTTVYGGIIQSSSTCRLWGNHFTQNVRLQISNMDFYEGLMHNSYFDGSTSTIGGNVSNLYQHGSILAILTSNYNFTLQNVETKALNILSTYFLDTWTGNAYYIDVVSDKTWNIDWVGVSDTGILWRQYTFKINVTDIHGVPIENANVTLIDINNDIEFTVLTGSNGSFTEQIVTYGFYNATGNDTPYLRTPHNLTITHSIYETLSYNVTIDEWKTVVQIVLISAQEDYSIAFLAIGLSIGICLVVAGVKFK